MKTTVPPVAVITGAGAGLGAAMATGAARRGYSVVLVDQNNDAIDRLAARLHDDAGIAAVAEPVDVRDHLSVEGLAARVFDRWSRTDLLINNAGIEQHGLVWETPIEHWNSVLDVNLNGTFHCVRAFVPRMLDSGMPGTIANIASVGALMTAPYSTAYKTSKNGCLAFTGCLSAELAAATDRIHVACVLPGAVRTGIAKASLTTGQEIAEQARRYLDTALETRGIEPGEAADMIYRGLERKLSLIHTDPDRSKTFVLEQTQKLLDSVEQSRLLSTNPNSSR